MINSKNVKLNKIQSIFWWAVAFLFIACLGTYFRTYSLHRQITPRADRLLAALAVEKVIIDQFQKELDASAPNLPADQKLMQARELARKAILSDRVGYEQRIDDVVRKYASVLPRNSGRKYLLEADSYYYFYLTEKLIENGRISSQVKAGKYYHPLMHAPDGYWAPVTWHPVIGYWIGSIVRWMRPQTDWMEALGWVPIVLSVAASFCFLIIARALGTSVFAFFIGSISLALSPIFLQRGAFGWYDTDPYNYIFPFLILAAIIFGILNQKWRACLTCLGGFLTGLYTHFWTGWPFILILIPYSLLGAYGISRWRWGRAGSASILFICRQTVYYVLSSVFFAALFLTPRGFIDSLQAGWDILQKFSLSDMDIWPNIFLTVGEAGSISIYKLIAQSGNFVTFGLAVAGIFLSCKKSWQQGKPDKFALICFLIFLTIPLLLMSLKTERFGILFVIPLSIWTMLGAHEIQSWLKSRIEKDRSSPVFFRDCLLITLFFAFFLILPVWIAHFVSLRVKPIMDDAWYDTMQELRIKTERDSIINSWWSPGYFISALAHRRTVADGGTQHMRENFWLAKILASQDEREAAGLLRMLNHTGNQAFTYLESHGFDVAKSVDLIVMIAPLSRKEAARKLPQEMPDPVKNRLLELTHSESRVSSYVLVYTDMVNQVLAVTVPAYWDFNKASEYKLKKRNWLNERSGDSIKNILNLTGGHLFAEPLVVADQNEGQNFHFPNGMTFNSATMDVLLAVSPTQQARPNSLFYIKDGKLEEKMFEGERIVASALVIQAGDSYHAVIADARLIRSLMFRLYYLKGEGLTLFKSFSWQRNDLNGDRVGVFKLISE